MSKLIYTRTSKLTESEWQTLRQSFVERGMVGGSDAGTLLGYNKYKSAINLFYQAVGINSLPSKMNAAMLHGKQLEEYVAKCWQYYDGTEEGWVNNTIADNKIKKYRKVKAIIENKKYPFLFANIDGKITKHPNYGNKAGLLEIKTISGFSADSYEAGIPPTYMLQVQHYMLVTGLTWAEICYLKDGRELGCITIEQDKDIQNAILNAAQDFHNRVKAAKMEMEGVQDEHEKMAIASKYEPDADSTVAFDKFISEKHKARESEVVITATTDQYAWAIAHSDLAKQIKDLEVEKQLYQNRIKQVMEKDGATVMNLPNDGRVTWRKQFIVKI